MGTQRIDEHGTTDREEILLSEVSPLQSPRTQGPGWTGRLLSWGYREGPEYGLVAALAVAVALACILLPDNFPTVGNISAMLGSESVTLILAAGTTLTLRLGDLDVSFGATMNFAATAVAVLTVNDHVSGVLALLVGVAVGLAVGALNALLIVTFGLNGFVATLGMMTLIEGLTYWISDSQVISGIPQLILNISSIKFLHLDLAVYYSWVIILIIWFVYRYMPFGRYLLFIGGNRNVSRLAGIRVNRVRWEAYCASGILYGVAGVVLAGTFGSADPSIGSQFLLPPLAAVFLGTTCIQRGRFNAIGTLVGAYLLLVISSALELAGVAAWVSDVFDGAALVGAIALARLLGRRSLTAPGF